MSTSRASSARNRLAVPSVDNIVHVVESVVGLRDRHLLGHHQRAAAEFENLPQRHQRAQAAGAAGRGRGDREHAALERGISRIAALAHARHPVDGVLEHRRDRGAVFRAGDEHAMMRHDHLLELERIGRRTGIGFEIAFVDRQRIIGERNAGHVGVDQRQLFRRQRRQPTLCEPVRVEPGKTRIFGVAIGGSVKHRPPISHRCDQRPR